MVYRDTKETEGRMNVEDKRRRDERFVEAIRQNRAGMFRVARMMLRSDSDAEEAVADATESAYAHLRALRNWEAVRPWLMRITVNACHKMLRRRKRETPSGDETLFDRPIKPSDATEIWSLVEQLDALYSASSCSTNDQISVASLGFIGLSNSVSSPLGVSRFRRLSILWHALTVMRISHGLTASQFLSARRCA